MDGARSNVYTYGKTKVGLRLHHRQKYFRWIIALNIKSIAINFLEDNRGEYFRIIRQLSIPETRYKNQLVIKGNIDKNMALLLKCYVCQRDG